ncbi:PLP-dependent aminotransferase family protein [Streptomyces sp. PTM05]|uniref:PLP-dependent aminotransferase family protein n=1 Tax=Streptantibioticus parmotrematis TaxID=2873249 RepID=A0ABS7QL59_9ACTN|nr:PLP-dependent aminotransferase family protein [Streptantibioticus parmotrematis]MBY8883913.1 PLP-dependent aminotransferase family protein [Streptantibioticus parmotrematis]
MDERANHGVDLHLELSRGGGLRAGLEGALRAAVREGRLTPGTRLPSSRTLAKDLGIARNTVADAYGQLVAEGWLTARQGSGTRVAGRACPEPPVPASTLVDASLHAAEHGLSETATLAQRRQYDLRPGSPDLSSFPRSAWLAAARQALNRAPNEAFGYTDPRGRPELREALAGYLSRARGVRAHPDLMVVCTGFVQAVGLLGRALAAGSGAPPSGRGTSRGGRRIAVEALGFPDTRTVLRRAGLTTYELPVDADGARVDALGDTDAVLLTPSHQYPTGVPLSPARRGEVVAWARRTGGVVVEDDYDGEFRYDRQPVGALQGLDPSAVVYAGTASKSLVPGLRLAWLALPARLLEPVVAEKRLADHHSPVLDQLTLAELITSGAYDRHVRRMRLHYRRRRDRLVAALAEHVPHVRVSGIAAGLHAVVELPPGSPSEAELVARAARLDLALAGKSYYGTVDAAGPALVIGYGSPPEHAFTGALERLCAVLAG